jgi:predicted  nucleic acid-binding Zn-ribbon protein
MENKNTEQLQTDVDYWKDIARKLVDEVKSKNQQIKSLESEKESLLADIKDLTEISSGQFNKAQNLESEVERLKEENTTLQKQLKGKTFDYNHAKKQLEIIHDDLESEKAVLESKNTQLIQKISELNNTK